MTLTVLSDDQVRAIIESLTLDELEDFRHQLAEALHEYSTGAQGSDESPYQQPHRATTCHPETQATTLYMPSCGPAGMGCKVLSLTTADGEDANVELIRPTGTVNLFSPTGQPIGLLHVTTLTAFRTALASSCLLLRRSNVKTITVFGSGMQAYWHVRLALMMRGDSIKHVNVINRRFSDNAGNLLRKFTAISANIKEREGWQDTKFTILTPTFHEFNRLKKEYVREADVIFCCTPSRDSLFEGSLLTSHEGRRKGRLIIAVGSFTPEMRELPDELLHQATKVHDKPHRHFHKHADEGGVIIVDTLAGALKEAGEIISAGIQATQLVELGELVMLHKQAVEESETDTIATQASTDDISPHGSRQPAMASVFGDREGRTQSPTRSTTSSSRKSSFSLPFRRRSSSNSPSRQKQKEDGLVRWLREGTVIYKSVGLGLMDLVVGTHLINVANQKQVGTQVADF
jgi:ornithine cyclodeaminase/alanine dehydrogenase-like protein (mu-crystallin family)